MMRMVCTCNQCSRRRWQAAAVKCIHIAPLQVVGSGRNSGSMGLAIHPASGSPRARIAAAVSNAWLMHPGACPPPAAPADPEPRRRRPWWDRYLPIGRFPDRGQPATGTFDDDHVAAWRRSARISPHYQLYIDGDTGICGGEMGRGGLGQAVRIEPFIGDGTFAGRRPAPARRRCAGRAGSCRRRRPRVSCRPPARPAAASAGSKRVATQVLPTPVSVPAMNSDWRSDGSSVFIGGSSGCRAGASMPIRDFAADGSCRGIVVPGSGPRPLHTPPARWRAARRAHAACS